MKINITIEDLVMEAELNDSSTAKKIIEILPIKTDFQTWGDEIYFSIPVNDGLNDTASEKIGVGDLGFWPSGKAFCIFFGPTPMSSSADPVPASAVNIIGRVNGDAKQFKSVMGVKTILIEPA